MQKNILVLSDFVGYGNVAMATSHAVLTALGHTVYSLPTALISNTWNFGRCAELDTTEYIRSSLENWEALGFQFDAVLIGYIGDEKQAELIGENCRKWKSQDITVILDPIFADNGKLYKGITGERLDFLRKLLPYMDYILPNQTEAQLLTGKQNQVEALHELVHLGAGCALITGTEYEGKPCVLLMDGEEEHILRYEPVSGSFPGAGDTFTALFAGEVIAGGTAEKSAKNAIETVREWILRSTGENWKGMGLPVERYLNR